MRKPRKTWRRQLYIQLEPRAWLMGVSPLNRLICGLILITVIAAALETEPSISRGYESITRALELIFSGLFLLEYLARVWVCVEDRRYRRPLRGRLKYMLTPAALLDLLASLPLLLGFWGAESLILRLVRLLRLLRLTRYGPLARALHHVVSAVHSRKYELYVSLIIAFSMIFISSVALYWGEGEVQPEAFGSIPRAMWWAIITFTTVGYGDVYPVTSLGKVFASVTALSSIALVAMPTGIMASAFSDAMRRGKDEISHIRK